MVMHEDIGNIYTGWYGIGTSGEAITNREIYVTGYPDKAGKQYHQYKSSGILNSDSDYTVVHTCSTQGGHSGAPLYSSSYVVWAIHNLGPAEGVTPTENYGVRITSSLYRLLINKKEETDT
jgi:V8-like Glu-specific endopeptidase